MAESARAPRVAFVNGGILGLATYATWLRHAFPDNSEIDADHIVLTEGLTPSERVIRRVMCQRLWPDPKGYANLDLARFRQELHAGLQARRRLIARGLDNVDVLHFHRQTTAYASLDLMERLPAIVSIDCTQACTLQTLGGALERWSVGFNVRRDREVFRRAAAIVSTSNWAANELRRDDPTNTTPIHVLAPPVMMDGLHERWIDERLERAERGGQPQLLFMGGDFPRKGGYDLLRVWADRGFHRRAALTMITDWPIEDALPEGVRIGRGVRAYTPEWLALWRSADIFVMPTRNEAFGLVYQEAAAAGIPAIGSALNAVPEIIDDGRTGLLVPPGDLTALGHAIDRLVEAPRLRRDMGRAARTAVAQHASSDDHKRRLLELIRSVERSGPRKGPKS